MKQGISDELHQKLKKIEQENNVPQDQETEVAIIENKLAKNSLNPYQYKISVPQSYAIAIDLGKKTHVAKATLIKSEKKIIIEIKKK